MSHTNQNTIPAPKLTIEELRAWWQVEQEAEDGWCEEENKAFKEKVKLLAKEEERQKWEVEEWRKWLEQAERKYEMELRQKELEKARQGKQKVIEMEGSSEETEMEPDGSKNKKVSNKFFCLKVINYFYTDKSKIKQWEDSTAMCYELFFFSNMCWPCNCLLFFILSKHVFTTPLYSIIHVFALRLTHALYIFKPIVRP